MNVQPLFCERSFSLFGFRSKTRTFRWRTNVFWQNRLLWTKKRERGPCLWMKNRGCPLRITIPIFFIFKNKILETTLYMDLTFFWRNSDQTKNQKMQKINSRKNRIFMLKIFLILHIIYIWVKIRCFLYTFFRKFSLLFKKFMKCICIEHLIYNIMT